MWTWDANMPPEGIVRALQIISFHERPSRLGRPDVRKASEGVKEFDAQAVTAVRDRRYTRIFLHVLRLSDPRPNLHPLPRRLES
jgi:hypothetical protein